MQMSAAAQDLAEPAKDLEELYERALDYVGELVSVDAVVSYVSNRKTKFIRKRRTAVLEGLRFIDDEEDGTSLSYRLKGRLDFIDLVEVERCELRVRLDGAWKLVHRGSALTAHLSQAEDGH